MKSNLKIYSKAKVNLKIDLLKPQGETADTVHLLTKISEVISKVQF
jgi:hypothetical protein